MSTVDSFWDFDAMYAYKKPQVTPVQETTYSSIDDFYASIFENGAIEDINDLEDDDIGGEEIEMTKDLSVLSENTEPKDKKKKKKKRKDVKNEPDNPAKIKLKELKKQRKLAQEKKEAELKSIELQSELEHIHSKLGTLNASKKKDAKKLAAYNIRIKEIEQELDELREKYKIEIKEIDRGSKVTNFLTKVKRGFKKFGRKFKKFFNKNAEFICTLGMTLLPVFGAFIGKGIMAA